jgi:dUTP pyrophosphatase
MKVKFKKLIPAAVEPSYSRPGDAGMDLTAIEMEHNREHQFVEYNTYIAVEIPEGHVGLVFPRSSVSKTPLFLANSVGVIDSNYRGPIKLRFKMDGTNITNVYHTGDRVGQLVIIPIPHIELHEVGDLSETNRGDGGFGSSGN